MKSRSRGTKRAASRRSRFGKRARSSRRDSAQVDRRARWVEAEVVACRRRGETFEDAAQHLMRVARKVEPSRTALDGVEFPPAGYRISAQACWAAYHRALDRVPVSEVEMVRKELDARDEILWAASQPGIEENDPRAIAVGVRVLECKARLHGAYAQPDAVVTINNIAALDLAALPPKEREALKMRLYEIDPRIPIEIVRAIAAEIDAVDAPSPPPSLGTTRALPPPESPSIITIEELEEARRSLEAAELDQGNQLPPDKA
jgi:hypothetical protein